MCSCKATRPSKNHKPNHKGLGFGVWGLGFGGLGDETRERCMVADEDQYLEAFRVQSLGSRV